MAAPPAELVSQIVELKNEFQHFADKHPWLCLYVPSLDKKHENLFLGEEAANRYFSNETTIRHPVTGDDIKVQIALGVGDPTGLGHQTVVDHVNHLTFRAEDLLKRVLEYDSRLAPDRRQEIREWEQMKSGYGWVRWLRHATVFRCVWRVENYAQAAATALWELKKCVEPTLDEIVKPPPEEATPAKRKRKKRRRKPAVKAMPRKKGGRPRSAEVEEVQAYLYNRWIKGDKLAAIRVGAEGQFGKDRAPKEDSHVTDGAQRYARKNGLPVNRQT